MQVASDRSAPKCKGLIDSKGAGQDERNGGGQSGKEGQHGRKKNGPKGRPARKKDGAEAASGRDGLSQDQVLGR